MVIKSVHETQIKQLSHDELKFGKDNITFAFHHNLPYKCFIFLTWTLVNRYIFYQACKNKRIANFIQFLIHCLTGTHETRQDKIRNIL